MLTIRKCSFEVLSVADVLNTVSHVLASTTTESFSVNKDRLKSLDAFQEALHQFEVLYIFL